MRAQSAARRNSDGSGALLGRNLTRALLLGALACSGRATSGGSDPVHSTSEAASASVAAVLPNGASTHEEVTEGSRIAPVDPLRDDTGREPMLAAPSSPPIGSPPSTPAPPPTTELDTPRAVNAESLDVAINDCRFEYLGEWIRCENAGWPNVVETDAADLASCMQRCLERDDCTAVTDYLWLGLPGIGCYLYLSTCDSPAFVVWGEEDAGRDFRRTCSSDADDGLPIDAGVP